MSVFNQLKIELDSAIFQTKKDPYTRRSNLDLNLRRCQDKFNKISANTYDNTPEPKSTRELFSELTKRVKEKIKTLENEITSKEKEEVDFEKDTLILVNKAKTEAIRNNYKRQISRKKEATKSSIKDLNDRIKQLNDYLIESRTFFDKVDRYKFVENREPRFDYEPSTDTRVIYYNGTYGSMLNELKHAFQYETGDLDFVGKLNESGGSSIDGGFLYDRPDEDETYERQYAFDGILKFRVKLKKNQTDDVVLGRLLGIDNFSEIITINKMSEITADIVVKIMDDDGTLLYNKISQKSLNKNSSIREVIKGNVNRPNLINNYGLKAIKKKNKVPYIDFIKVFTSEKHKIHVKKH